MTEEKWAEVRAFIERWAIPGQPSLGIPVFVDPQVDEPVMVTTPSPRLTVNESDKFDLLRRVAR